jgi:2-oxoglutarate ferredoxin oxidoreductase subunit alpha
MAGAIAAGVDFFAGYPITPSTEVAEQAAELLPPIGGRFIQMEDEIASMGAIIGAALTGRKAMTATSGPGFSLKQECIGYAAITEVPCVIVNVQRAGPSTGIPTAPAQGDVMQARWGSHGDYPAVALCPSSVSETFDLTVRAVNLAERYRTPVVVLLDEIVGHMREEITIPDTKDVKREDRSRPTCDPKDYKPYDSALGEVAPLADFGSGYPYHVTGLSHDKEGFTTAKAPEVDFMIRHLKAKIENNLEDILAWEEFNIEDADIVLVAYGITARAARAAMRMARAEGIKVGLFRPITIWPFPEAALLKAAKGKKVIVPEMNMGQLALEIERIVKADICGVFQADGEPITPGRILQAVKEQQGVKA